MYVTLNTKNDVVNLNRDESPTNIHDVESPFTPSVGVRKLKPHYVIALNV